MYVLHTRACTCTAKSVHVAATPGSGSRVKLLWRKTWTKFGVDGEPKRAQALPLSDSSFMKKKKQIWHFSHQGVTVSPQLRLIIHLSVVFCRFK